MKKLSIVGSALFALPLFFASCSSESCRTCDCSITETRNVTYDGTTVSDTENSSKSLTACDSDVNNPAAASWEYYDANPTTVEEYSETMGSGDERKTVRTTSYNCSCEED